MSIFFLLFMFNAVSEKIISKTILSQVNTNQIVFNNIALYAGTALMFTNSDIANITLIISIVAAIQAIILYLYNESYAKKMLAYFSFALFILFIAFTWNDFTVTLLWLVIAISVFGIGAIKKWREVRITAMILMGITLLKLLAFDSRVFSTMQKVLAYIFLGILLLVVGYLYQKFKHYLFVEESTE